MSEPEETLCSFTSTSSSTYTYGSTTESVKTQIEIALTKANDTEDAKDESETEFPETSVTPTPSSVKYEIRIPVIGDVESPSHSEEKFTSYDEDVVKFTAPDEPYTANDDDDDDDDTLSSEAMVDDIELILMPEETMDLPQVYSPKLVRVRELLTDDEGHLVDEDDEDDDCNFRKMDGSERSYDRRAFQTEDGSDEGEPLEIDGAVGFTNLCFGRSLEGGDDEDPSFASSTTSGIEPRGKYWRRSLASSGVQTDITALDVGHRQPIICDYRFGAGGRKVMTSSSGKRLNWKSELTLLPSKTKVGHHHHFAGPRDDGGLRTAGTSVGFNGDREDDERDQYSTGRGVAKFTSQDNVLSSSSQFLKPSTLYRTRNLSRNLNQLGSSETSFILPEGETTPGLSPHSSRIRTPWTTNPPLAKGIGSSGVNQRRPTAPTKSFRSSLPDLTPGIGEVGKYPGARRRQSHQYSTAQTRLLRQSVSGTGSQGTSFGSTGTGLRKFRKKSSSDEETSSLIDESERCLRSSIDLFLTDDIPAPGYDYPYCGGSSAVGMGRRYCSQPILTEEAYFYREPRNNAMGSPFLPRRMSDMRCSKYAKVILPDGQVSVVSVLEIDEAKDLLKVLPDSGSPIVIPFRKVVFAWRNSRR